MSNDEGQAEYVFLIPGFVTGVPEASLGRCDDPAAGKYDEARGAPGTATGSIMRLRCCFARAE
jgi:hypothetical protein